MTTIRLAVTGLSLGRATATFTEGMQPASILASYHYLAGWQRFREHVVFRDWVLDSGAFSAWKIGVEIDLQAYIDECLKLAESDASLVEIFSLDVVGDWEASARNTEEMWRQGVEAIPVYHHGEPWDALTEMAAQYPRISIGGVVGKISGNRRIHFLEQCFARVWPKKVHGLGITGVKDTMAVPFHTVDSTTWQNACRFGIWRGYGGSPNRLPVKGSDQNLRVEVEYYLDLERRLRQRWRKEMKMLDEGN